MTHPRPDPIDEYAAVLGAALHGPTRAKDRIVEEIRSGLGDAAAAHTGDGVSHDMAVHEAVRHFGTPDELIADCQRELTICQTRRTASSLAFTVPALLVCWHPLWARGDLAIERIAAIALAGVTTVTALHAMAVLLVTGRLGRWFETPARLPLVTAWVATTASVTMMLTTVALAAASTDTAAGPLILLAVGATIVIHAVVATSARSCRRCSNREPRAGDLPSV